MCPWLLEDTYQNTKKSRIILVVECPQKTYQDQFVKTRFPRIWSNRDMDIFSFWPISPQFA